MKLRSLVLAAGFALCAPVAYSAVIPLITGAQDPSQLNNTLNGIIGQINTNSGGSAAANNTVASPRNVNTCGFVPNPATSAFTDQTPVATEVYIAEVFIPANMSVTGVAIFNGSVASGNLKVGLANSSGANVATSASTAMAGTTAYQRIAFTAPYAAAGPATYYITTFVDNATARLSALTDGNCGAAKQTGQTFATGFTTITPPSTFTTALGPVAGLY